jgi:hypothetical protein
MITVYIIQITFRIENTYNAERFQYDLRNAYFLAAYMYLFSKDHLSHLPSKI